MLSIFDQGRPAACPTPFNLAAHVLGRADARADHPAIVIASAHQEDEVWTYRQIQNAALGIATGLREKGFTPGDILLMRLGNTIDFPLCFLGAIAAGLVPVPTAAQLTEPEVARIMAELSPAGMLLDPRIAHVPHPRSLEIDQLRAMWHLPPAPYDMGAPDRMAYLIYTSGTGGSPRAVAHAHRAIWARQMMIRDWYDLHPDDRLLHAGAFNWTFTLGTGILDPLTVGATAIIPAQDRDIADIPQILKQSSATLFAAVPGVYRKILKSEQLPDLPHLRHGLAAGEKLSGEIRDLWRQRIGTEIYEAFGMSECSTFISSAPHRPADGVALGTPQRGRKLAILAEDGPVEIGQEGVIAIHREDPGLMLGYHGAPEATHARFQGAWFVTGDRGVMSESGQIRYCGRDDDMMNAGGFRLSPLEVEKAFATCDGITEFAVAEVEVKPDVHIIVGFYTGREDVTETRLRAFAEAELADYKRPKAYMRLAHMPSNPNGKLLRRALPDLFKE
ncbi:class I adenylate-forming enzyme family protein [Phaeobacter sp. HF9A]|uniref:class I adenylate-forming enzyme family protein n=1 Tax=Phaeobacter sp. HF9A TaxID=2721561 RepID=UPI0014306CB3|nr:class I adenylate-forming enzyme family protein [Phaeobacter sp. HF9A]NIZ12210.1 acyl--CoA ligase [Phaeobacter sp. HF9A]